MAKVVNRILETGTIYRLHVSSLRPKGSDIGRRAETKGEGIEVKGRRSRIFRTGNCKRTETETRPWHLQARLSNDDKGFPLRIKTIVYYKTTIRQVGVANVPSTDKSIEVENKATDTEGVIVRNVVSFVSFRPQMADVIFLFMHD